MKQAYEFLKAKFLAFPMKDRAIIVALAALTMLGVGDYALRIRPAALSAGQPVVIPHSGNGKFGATGDNAAGIVINTSTGNLDLNAHKVLHMTNGSASDDGAAFGQIPTASTATPAALGTAAVGSGTTWAKADHVHAMPTLDVVNPPLASVNLNSQKLISMADGTASSDGAAFHQIGDAILAGRQTTLDAISPSTNQATLTGLAQTIDGVALSVAGMRVGLFGQTTTTQDGCYVTASGAWTRCTDLPTGAAANHRHFVTVAGSSNKGVWSITNASGSDVVGTNDLAVANQATGGGGAVSSVFGRTGTVTATSGDYTFSQIGQATADVTFGDGTQKLLGLANPAPGTNGAANAFYVDDPNNANVTKFGSDLAAAVTGAVTNGTVVDGLQAITANSGTITILSTGNDDKTIGVAQLSTAGTTNGTSILLTAPSTTAGGTVQLKTTARVVLDAKLSIATVSDGTNTFTVRLGWADSSVAPTNGIWLSVNANSDVHWVCNSTSTGTAHTTTTTTTSTNSAATETHVRITKAAGADSYTANVDGTDICTVSTDIPTATNLFGFISLVKSAGTSARTTNVDWLRGTYTYVRAQ